MQNIISTITGFAQIIVFAQKILILHKKSKNNRRKDVLILCAEQLILNSQENELLCKIIAYNLTVLIHSMIEMGITPDIFPSIGVKNIVSI